MTSRAKSIVMTGCFLLALIASAQHAGIRINTTHSYPPGLYIKTHDPIKKGALVIFCPPDTKAFQEARARGYIGPGFCPGGYEYMIKKILAAPGDHVTISDLGVTVNGTLLPNSKPMDVDLEGRPLPHLTVDIPALDVNSVLLMSDYSAKSFDARYFGVADRAMVISTVRPLWVW
jgi:conjugative transfer signal peptidase TraF